MYGRVAEKTTTAQARSDQPEPQAVLAGFASGFESGFVSGFASGFVSGFVSTERQKAGIPQYVRAIGGALALATSTPRFPRTYMNATRP